MLSLGKFPTQTHYNTLLHIPISQHLQFSSKPHFSFSTRLSSQAVLGKLRNGLHCNSTKTQKKGDLSLTKMDGLDEFENDGLDDGFLDVDDDEFDVGEDEDEIVIPSMNMKRWLANRPRGFGEDKVYDTSIEDKAMEEIEQSRKAELANVNKLKNSTLKLKPEPKKEINKQDKGSTLVQDGFRVRLLNLPKKKNIHKDLRLAFKGVRGILNIVPLVSGNGKTRDPVSKGLAFIDFKNQDDGQRFVQNFSGKSITFGKVQKKIKCEMTNFGKSRDPSVDENNFTRKQAVYKSDVKYDADVQIEVSQLDLWEESVPSEVDGDDSDEEINGMLTHSHSDLAEELEVQEGFEINSASSKQTRKLKKVLSKRRKSKIPKFNIPGSANGLKIREKEMLMGVFTKYSATVKEHSR